MLDLPNGSGNPVRTKTLDFKTRVIGGSGSPLGSPAIRGGSFDDSPLPTHHFLDPDRGEG